MPWISSVAGLVQAWYSGNEVGNALADVLFGKVNPSACLPLTLPKREQDIPAFLNYRSENGKVYYLEDLHVGYKHYQAKDIEPLFPFG
jgi:beta-glucosidase